VPGFICKFMVTGEIDRCREVSESAWASEVASGRRSVQTLRKAKLLPIEFKGPLIFYKDTINYARPKGRGTLFSRSRTSLCLWPKVQSFKSGRIIHCLKVRRKCRKGLEIAGADDR